MIGTCGLLDFAINEMEFGKELEELLGMPHSNSFVQNPEPGIKLSFL